MNNLFKITCFHLIVLGLSSQAGELISTAVGQVGKRAVTSRETQIEYLVDVALTQPLIKDNLKPLPLDSKAFAKAVQDTLLDHVIALEAQSFNLMQIPPEELVQAKSKTGRVLRQAPAWTKLQVTPAEFEAALRRRIQARHFIQFRSDSSQLPVADAEVQRYFSENRAKYGDLPFEKCKEEIKSVLTKTQVERRLKDWFEVLLSKYQVKNLISEM